MGIRAFGKTEADKDWPEPGVMTDFFDNYLFLLKSMKIWIKSKSHHFQKHPKGEHDYVEDIPNFLKSILLD